jgi:tetraacyldisaccharide 4'-kinase
MKKYLSKLYEFLVQAKNFVYDEGWLDQIKLSVPVVSVGNLSSGGTGKTPFVDLVISYYEKKGKKVGVVCRNYKAKIRFTDQIDLQHPQGASFYGDEAWWLAHRHPQAVVVVTPLKWWGAWKLVSKIKVDVVIVDDGFQHRSLARDLDIVLVDATTAKSEEQWLPLGLARESFQSLNRADLVVLTKCQLVDEVSLQNKKSLIPATKKVVCLKSEIDFSDFKILEKSNVESGDLVVQESIPLVWAVAGIAKPEQFFNMLESNPNLKVKGTQSFPDHFAYQVQDIRDIEKRAEDCDVILTTEKDFVKIKLLKNSLHSSAFWQALPLQTQISEGEENLNAVLDSIFS